MAAASVTFRPDFCGLDRKNKSFIKIIVLNIWLLGVFWPLSGFSEDSGKAEQIIAASKAATGGANWDQIKTWRETGTLTLGGLEGTYEAWFNFPEMRSAEVYTLGPTKGSEGWNGTVSWSTDASDQLRIETSRQAIANAIKG